MEEVIIKIELEKGDNERQIDNVSKKLIELQAANKNLIAQNKELAKQGKENSQEYIENTRQIEINKQKITEATATRKGLIQTLIAEDNSIKSLRVQNAELIKERDRVNIRTEEGRKKIEELNQQIDFNNDLIKQNSSALEKQKLNVGNYTNSIREAISEIKIAGFSLNDLTTKIASFANPVTAAIAVLGGLTAAYARSSIGAKDLEFAKNQLSSAISIVTDRFAKLFSSAEDGEGILSKLTGAAITTARFLLKINIPARLLGFSDVLDDVGEKSRLAALASDELNKIYEERELILARVSERQAENSELLTDLADTTKTASERQEIANKIQENSRKNAEERVASIDAEIAAIRRKNVGIEDEGVFIREINALKRERAQVVTQTTKEIEKAQKQLNAILRAEDKQRAAEALADLKERLAREEQLKREQLAEDAKIRLDIEQAEKEQFKNNLDFLKAQGDERLLIIKSQLLNELITREEFEQSKLDLEIASLEEQKAFLEANGLSTLAIDTQITDAKIKNKEREVAAEKKLADEKKKQDQQNLNAQRQTVDAGLGLLQEGFGETQEIAAAGATISTYRAAAAALEPPPLGLGPVFGPILATLTTVRGLLQVARIFGVTFAKGGITKTGGMLSGPSHEQGGIPFSVGGKLGFEAEGGEAIINKRSSKMFRRELSAINVAGGGVSFGRGGIARYQTGSIISGTQTRAASQIAEGRSQVRDLIKGVMTSMPPIVVTVEDINAKQEEVRDITTRATVI